MVHEIQPNKWTALTKQNLLHLAQVYDLSPLLFTKQVNVNTNAKTHSHPILTLNTHYSEHPNRLLSQFLHEELHWWIEIKKVEVDKAIKELVKIYPKVPVAKNEKAYSTYQHLIICFIELKTLSAYLGDKEARAVLNYKMKKDKNYPWVYSQVLNKDFALRKVIDKYKLLPPH